MLLCAIALLMPSVMHFGGSLSLPAMLIPMVLALLYGVCAWQLREIRPNTMRAMFVLNSGVMPALLFYWLGFSGYSAPAIAMPFVLQQMVLLLMPCQRREVIWGAWVCAFIAVSALFISPNPMLDRIGSVLALLLATLLTSLVALQLTQQQRRLGLMRHHVQKHSEKMAVRAEEMRRLALADTLTGLANRLRLIKELERLLADTPRARGAFLYLIDLDFFKTVNDRFGHAAGDAVLIECGRRFRSVVRRGDLVSRLGGDEFVILIRNLAGPEQARRVAEKVLGRLAEPLIFHGQPIPLGGSIGICPWHAGVSTPDGWLSEADAAMYLAKVAGRNRYRFSPSP